MVELRPVPVDDPVARELLTEYFALRAQSFPGNAYTTVFPSVETFTPPEGVFLVLYDDAELAVGCGGIRRVADGSLGGRYEVKHLYLRPETRGRGWGRLLLDDLERRARRWDAAELVLDTHHTLEAAGGLYASAGFREIEPYNDNPNATRWYGLRLAPAEGGETL
ncbi:GNAT family N-acetyltransferase [Microbacterium sp. BK668]|uniref:GNAT family N-acetyltransferase n=1 Tax=Microbacterium sp. BK668 TaxID=2512118 RepID=UPI00106013F4|nr:GNAT family N-acetyltransferase [Microbacterium sp. BK668]TDN88613.1 ribosomal protein S18 acetylase RimI-like enzyme [Microbacterium sp. BK668]